MVDMAVSMRASVMQIIQALLQDLFLQSGFAGPLDSRNESNLTARLSCISKYLRLMCNGHE